MPRHQNKRLTPASSANSDYASTTTTKRPRTTASNTPKTRLTKKEVVWSDPEKLLNDAKSPLYELSEAEILKILTNPLIDQTIGDSEDLKALRGMTEWQLREAVRGFRNNGRGGFYDREWIEQAVVAVGKREEGLYEGYLEGKFREDWIVGQGFEDEESEEGMKAGEGKWSGKSMKGEGSGVMKDSGDLKAGNKDYVGVQVEIMADVESVGGEALKDDASGEGKADDEAAKREHVDNVLDGSHGFNADAMDTKAETLDEKPGTEDNTVSKDEIMTPSRDGTEITPNSTKDTDEVMGGTVTETETKTELQN